MLVSIIIPVFNRVTRIGSALESIRRQTHEDWEVIVVDDGSTDRTPEAVKNAGRHDSRIRIVVHEQNRGAQAARNTGILAARGDWIAFLDSDDEYLPTSLEGRIKVAEKESVLVVHSNCYKIFEDSRNELFRVPPLSGQIYKRLLIEPGPLFPGMLVKKTALERISYLDEKIKAFQEWDTAIRLARYFEFGFQPNPTFTYDCRGKDTISKQSRVSAQGYEQVFYKHFPAIFRHAGVQALANHYDTLNWLYKAGEDYRKARISRSLSLACRCLSLRAVLGKLNKMLTNECWFR